MNLYEVQVMETVTRSRTYIVEAENPDDARSKAERGTTVSEFPDGEVRDVIEREVFDVFDYQAGL